MKYVVWLANNVSHYHRARAGAFAKTWPGRFTILELCDKNELHVLQNDSSDRAGVETLFRDKKLAEISRSALREAVFRYLDTEKPEVCCLNGWGMPGTAVMLHWALRRGVPCVLMSDSNKHDFKRTWLKEAFKRRFIGFCNAALVAGRYSREYLIHLGMEAANIFDGYDVVDNGHFRTGAGEAKRNQPSTRSRLGLPDHYFFTCARFEPKKNLAGLIQAFSIFTQAAGPRPWKLVIAGDGLLRRDLEALVVRLGLQDNIIFAGLRTYQELPAFYGLADAYVHASTTEQWGLVVNEAMAAGLPVLVSRNCGCAADLVENGGNGFTFNPLLPREIAEKMLLVFRDSALRARMAQRSEEIIAGWEPARFAANLSRAINQALAGGKPSREYLSRMLVRLKAAC